MPRPVAHSFLRRLLLIQVVWEVRRQVAHRGAGRIRRLVAIRVGDRLNGSWVRQRVVRLGAGAVGEGLGRWCLEGRGTRHRQLPAGRRAGHRWSLAVRPTARGKVRRARPGGSTPARAIGATGAAGGTRPSRRLMHLATKLWAAAITEQGAAADRAKGVVRLAAE